jgi:hypothetical protein
MRIQSRVKHAFIDLKIDQIETTIFREEKEEINSTIENLLNIVADLSRYTDKSVIDFVKELEL